ncbi:665_t:CDS:2 [Dentiscutata heterogama]|uniref:665_t:CDS:1 n=1 Tax=Dentiscutata heterogama TaxID=1316150 RepID=A0ACA9KUH7_9GLOM|nr:665_t:CDS:2 [Dentiscutata heterogama]
MTELPEKENDALAALQSLIYEGPPEEVAENFKNQGNECFKTGKSQYQDAINFYMKALETNCQDNRIIEACLTNRAAINLELQPNNLALQQLRETCIKQKEILDQKAKIKEEQLKESGFNEGNTFLDHLEMIFEQPAPWDIEHNIHQIIYKFTTNISYQQEMKRNKS